MMYLMVLNDGTTYSDLKGCQIVAFDREEVELQGEDLNDLVAEGEGDLITTFA